MCVDASILMNPQTWVARSFRQLCRPVAGLPCRARFRVTISSGLGQRTWCFVGGRSRQQAIEGADR